MSWQTFSKTTNMLHELLFALNGFPGYTFMLSDGKFKVSNLSLTKLFLKIQDLVTNFN